MNHSDNIHRLFDGELSEEEKSILEEAMAADPSLLEDLKSVETMAALHADSIPEPKDELFIEREFLEIQKQIQTSPKSETESQRQLHATADSIPEAAPSKANIITFPSSNWLKGSIAVAAALAITVTGAWLWNQDPSMSSTTPDAATVAFVETDIDGASSMIYMDEQSGWTFVWVDEPLDQSAEIAG